MIPFHGMGGLSVRQKMEITFSIHLHICQSMEHICLVQIASSLQELLQNSGGLFQMNDLVVYSNMFIAVEELLLSTFHRRRFIEGTY